MPNRKGNLREKIATTLLGLALVFLLLEASLRALGVACERRDSAVPAGAAPGSRVILCVGDSFTWGAGAAVAMSWPRQLERLLNETGGQRYAVVNRGMGSQNTARLLQNLQRNLDSTRPDLVILLTGSANSWDEYGSRQEHDEGTWSATVHDAVYRIRVFKLAKLLYLGARETHARAETARRRASLQASKRAFEEEVERTVPAEQRSRSQACYLQGRRSWLACRTSEARARFLEGITANPHNTDNYVGMAESCARDHLNAEALEWGKKALEADPYSVRAHMTMARVLCSERSVDQAIEWLQKAREIAPGDPLLLGLLGTTYARAQRYSEALSSLDQALEASPQDRLDLLLDRALVYELMQDFERARADLREVLRGHPEDERCWLRMGDLLRSKGDYRKAIGYYEMCLENRPQAVILKHLGDCLRYSNRTREALECYEEAAALSPADAAESLADAYRQAGRESEAVSWYRRAVAANPAMASDIQPKLVNPETWRAKIREEILTPRDPAAPVSPVETWITADITRAIAMCRRAGVPVLMHSYPGETVRKALLARIASDNGVPFVDHQPTFRELRNPENYFTADLHCNDLGYTVMAQDLKPKVLEILSRPR